MGEQRGRLPGKVTQRDVQSGGIGHSADVCAVRLLKCTFGHGAQSIAHGARTVARRTGLGVLGEDRQDLGDTELGERPDDLVQRPPLGHRVQHGQRRARGRHHADLVDQLGPPTGQHGTGHAPVAVGDLDGVPVAASQHPAQVVQAVVGQRDARPGAEPTEVVVDQHPGRAHGRPLSRAARHAGARPARAARAPRRAGRRSAPASRVPRWSASSGPRRAAGG